MAQKLYIHSGMPKTGTTSAQAFMWANRKKLAGLGFYYPDTMRPPKPVQAQHTFLNVYIRQQNQAHAETGKPLAYEAVDVMVKEIKEANCPVNLISEEQLSFDANVTAPFLGRFKEHFDVKIIVFLRRQDVWVESMYA